MLSKKVHVLVFYPLLVIRHSLRSKKNALCDYPIPRSVTRYFTELHTAALAGYHSGSRSSLTERQNDGKVYLGVVVSHAGWHERTKCSVLCLFLRPTYLPTTTAASWPSCPWPFWAQKPSDCSRDSGFEPPRSNGISNQFSVQVPLCFLCSRNVTGKQCLEKF